MHFLFYFSFYFIMSSTNGCRETENGNSQCDTPLETNHLQHPGQYQDGASVMIDSQMEQRLNQMLQSGDFDFEKLHEKMSAIFNDPDFQMLLNGFGASYNMHEDTIESETCGADGPIQIASNEIGGSCAP